ncbi:S-layer homology domain-containing protein [Sporosarcina luteola]|uniref:S-layer homology domain-containing protein n=1 Tax=Sporosarcina luteola TaxID=582850 RepID=UPI0033411117
MLLKLHFLLLSKNLQMSIKQQSSCQFRVPGSNTIQPQFHLNTNRIADIPLRLLNLRGVSVFISFGNWHAQFRITLGVRLCGEKCLQRAGIDGGENGKFRPNEKITRRQVT